MQEYKKDFSFFLDRRVLLSFVIAGLACSLTTFLVEALLDSVASIHIALMFVTTILSMTGIAIIFRRLGPARIFLSAFFLATGIMQSVYWMFGVSLKHGPHNIQIVLSLVLLAIGLLMFLKLTFDLKNSLGKSVSFFFIFLIGSVGVTWISFALIMQF